MLDSLLELVEQLALYLYMNQTYCNWYGVRAVAFLNRAPEAEWNASVLWSGSPVLDNYQFVSHQSTCVFLLCIFTRNASRIDALKM